MDFDITDHTGKEMGVLQGFTSTIYNFKSVYDSVRRELLFNSAAEFGIQTTLVTLIKMHFNKIYNKVLMGKTSVSRNSYSEWSETRRCFTTIVCNFALENTIRKVSEIKGSLELNGAHQLLVHGDDVNLLGENINIIKENTKVLIHTSMEISFKVHTKKTK
jgi:hypothetical protein